jgi:hypothetical protein
MRHYTQEDTPMRLARPYLLFPFIVGLFIVLGSSPAFARGGGRSSSYTSHRSYSYSPRLTGHTSSRKAVGVVRDKNGHIARSSTARERFLKSHPCPSTGKTSGACPGYVVDHIQALKHGGKDDPSNMQWQTIQAAKDKDRWE